MARADGEAAGAAALAVAVAYGAAPRTVETVALCLPAGSTVADALSAAAGRWPQHAAALQALAAEGGVAVWGQGRALDAPLRDGDRVEFVRGLQVDPKEARRLRQQQQQGDTRQRPPARAAGRPG